MTNLGPGGRVVFGVFVGLASTSIQSLGLTLQRKSHILEDEKPIDEVPRPPYRRRRWQLGMGMFIIANIVGSTIQITTLPLPVLSTLQASGLVFNSICATLILHEPFTRYSLAGTILVSGGAVLIAIFGAVAEPPHDLTALLRLFERAEFIIWIIGTAILIGMALVGARLLKNMTSSPKTRLLRGMAYGFVSGTLSAHSLLMAKSAVELVVRTISDHVNQFNRWQSFAILLGLVALAGSQLMYLHKGLKLCSTSILYPFVFCIYNIIAILDGLIYFDQTSRITLSHGLLVLLGTVILLIGVVCLSWRLNDAEPDAGPLLLDSDLAYLDSDASSLSSTALDSPPPTTETTSLLSKPPVSSPNAPPLFAPRRVQTLSELESGTYGATSIGTGAATGTTSPNAARRSVHWDPTSLPMQSASGYSLHSIGDDSTARKASRRQAYLEADALWDELQEAPDRVAPLAGDSTSSLFQPRTRSRSLALHSQQARATPSPPPGSPGGGTPSFSPGPLARSGTGRSYRDRRPRRPSAFGGYFPPTPERSEAAGEGDLAAGAERSTPRERDSNGRERSETPRARLARRATLEASSGRLQRVWRALSDAGRSVADVGRGLAGTEPPPASAAAEAREQGDGRNGSAGSEPHGGAGTGAGSGNKGKTGAADPAGSRPARFAPRPRPPPLLEDSRAEEAAADVGRRSVSPRGREVSRGRSGSRGHEDGGGGDGDGADDNDNDNGGGGGSADRGARRGERKKRD